MKTHSESINQKYCSKLAHFTEECVDRNVTDGDEAKDAHIHDTR